MSSVSHLQMEMVKACWGETSVQCGLLGTSVVEAAHMIVGHMLDEWR